LLSTFLSPQPTIVTLRAAMTIKLKNFFMGNPLSKKEQQKQIVNNNVIRSGGICAGESKFGRDQDPSRIESQPHWLIFPKIRKESFFVNTKRPFGKLRCLGQDFRHYGEVIHQGN